MDHPLGVGQAQSGRGLHGAHILGRVVAVEPPRKGVPEPRAGALRLGDTLLRQAPEGAVALAQTPEHRIVPGPLTADGLVSLALSMADEDDVQRQLHGEASLVRRRSGDLIPRVWRFRRLATLDE